MTTLDAAAAPAALPEDLARRMIPVVRRVAHTLARHLPRHVRVEDLIGAGFHGLVAAYARFDPRRGEDFESYAEFRIRGAMLDELRASDPLSRDRRALAKQTAAAARAACSRLGRAATAEEIAAELGLPIEAYWARLSAVANVVTDSLDDADDERGPVQVLDTRVEPADEQLARRERHEAVRRAIAELPPRLAQVVELHFVEGVTLREIGARFGVTESRICQLVTAAVRLIREKCPDFVPAPEAEPAPASGPRSRRRPAALAA